MKAKKDPKTGKWLIQYRYTNWQGKRIKTMKRGFDTKREAEEWLRGFLLNQSCDFTMKFKDFIEIYLKDMGSRLREHTMETKKYIIDLKIIPYFGEKSVNKITAADVRRWQNELMSQGYSQTYLKTINNQLTAIFNYAVRYYDLAANPCRKAGSMGKGKADEMLYVYNTALAQYSEQYDLGFVNFPGSTEGGVNSNWLTGFMAFDNGDPKKVEVIKDFVKFIYETPELMEYSTGGVPCSKTVIEKYKDQIKMSDEFLKNEANTVDFTANNPNWAGVREAFWPHINALLSGDETAEEAAAGLDADCNAAITSVERKLHE